MDFNTATPREVIQRSLRMHPTAMRDELLALAKVHDAAAASTLNHTASRAATELAFECRWAAASCEEGDIANIMANMSRWTSALLVAGRLQCINRRTISDIAARAEG